MRKIKLWKIIISSFTIICGTTSATTSLVSCGKKNTPPPLKQTWDQFLKKANAESFYNIVQNAKPPANNWKNLPSTDFIKYNNMIVNKPIITIEILSKSLSEYASFLIVAPSNNDYKVSNWACTKQPKPTPSKQWNIFKTAAITVTAAKLLTQAKTINDYKKFHWIGDTTQQTWQTGQMAEFDVYGGNGGSDTYLGMNGKPLISEINHTITAIISISDGNKRGKYDADPIQAVITDQGSSYQLSDWVFSQTNQLQSQQKYLVLFAQSIGTLPNYGVIKITDPAWKVWTHFADNNFISNDDPNHTADNFVTSYLNHHSFPKLIKIRLFTYTQLEPDNNNRLKSVLSIYLWTRNNILADATMKLTGYFNFKDNSNQNVGTAFNFNWHADIATNSENV